MDGPEELFMGSPLKVLTGGASRPLMALLEPRDGVPSTWVVKMPWPGRPSVLAAEAVGADFCRLLGVRAPTSGYMRLPVAWDGPNSQATRRLQEAVSTHPGCLTFCCEELPDAYDHEQVHWKRRDPVAALRLFALDAFLWNFDRITRRPNLMWSNGVPSAIDHGLCLSGVESINEDGTRRYDPASHRSKHWKDHIATDLLRRKFKEGALKPENIEEVLIPLRSISADDVKALLDRWPEGMFTLDFHADALHFLTARLSQLDSLCMEISDGLAPR